MVKKNNSKEKTTKDFTIDFNVPIKFHKFTLKSAKKWFENNIKVNNQENASEDKIKLNISSENILVISIDKSINFPKRKIRTLVKKFLKVKGAKYYNVSPTSPNDFKVILVK